MKKIISSLLVVGLMSSFSFALDKKKLEINIRKSLNLTTNQKIVVNDPTPSEFAPLQNAIVQIDSGQYPILLSADGSKYFWGQVFDATVDPDKMRADKISLTKVHSHGKATAPVKVVEFTDLQCPYCQKAHTTIKESLYKDYTGDKVQLVFKNFPLSNHDWAEKGALVSECASLQKPNAFWDITDLYFQNQEKINAQNFEAETAGFVQKLKLNKAQIDQCVKDPKILEQINREKSEGQAVGVSGTPTFFVNGRMIRGSRYEDLKSVIEEKLQELKK